MSAQATPAMAAPIWPMMPPLSWMARSTMPTVAVMTAQTRIGPMCDQAMRKPSRTVGSPPRSRMSAAPTSAALQKITTALVTT